MATIADMGIPAAESIQGILQPFHKHRWEIQFLFGGGVSSSDTKRLTAMAITADRPKLELEEIQLDRYNSRAFIFGKHTFQPINIQFEPDIGGAVHRAIIQQLERQQHLIDSLSQRFMGSAEAGQDYKFGMIMKMLNGHHNNPGGQVLEQWLIEGCGLQNNDFGDLDYAASETLKTMLTIRYDHARLQPLGSRERFATGGGI